MKFLILIAALTLGACSHTQIAGHDRHTHASADRGLASAGEGHRQEVVEISSIRKNSIAAYEDLDMQCQAYAKTYSTEDETGYVWHEVDIENTSADGMGSVQTTALCTFSKKHTKQVQCKEFAMPLCPSGRKTVTVKDLDGCEELRCSPVFKSAE